MLHFLQHFCNISILSCLSEFRIIVALNIDLLMTTLRRGHVTITMRLPSLSHSISVHCHAACKQYCIFVTMPLSTTAWSNHYIDNNIGQLCKHHVLASLFNCITTDLSTIIAYDHWALNFISWNDVSKFRLIDLQYVSYRRTFRHIRTLQTHMRL